MSLATMIRDFQESDFDGCAHLVNKVWDFDRHFPPSELSNLFLRIYTGSSLAESNFKKVVDENGKISGFLFGKVENQPLQMNDFRGFFIL